VSAGAKVVRLTGITPRELARRCRAHPAVDRVESTGTDYRVYPTDITCRPVFFSKAGFGSSGKCENTLRDLRKSGIDVERPPDPIPTPKPTPIPTTQEAPVSAPARPAPHAPLMDRREGAELRDMVRLAVEGTDAVTAMMVEAEKRVAAVEADLAAAVARIERQDREIAQLRSGGAAARPPSQAELIRNIVVDYFKSMPGVKLSPQVVDLNAPGLPEGRGATATANACKALANDGVLCGGGRREQSNREKGIYWYEPPAEES
jgi:hypothetical protein